MTLPLAPPPRRLLRGRPWSTFGQHDRRPRYGRSPRPCLLRPSTGRRWRLAATEPAPGPQRNSQSVESILCAPEMLIDLRALAGREDLEEALEGVLRRP